MPTTGQDTTSDPPPSSVIVTEYAGASTQGGSGMGKADDGWGDTSGQAGYASSSGTHYEVKDGSSGSITVTSGTLSASTPDNTTPDANGNFSGLGVLVAVGFSVAGANATISLPGASSDVDGTKIALTGQQVTAHLDNAPAHVTSYTWSFSGGTPIKDWDPTWPNSTNPTQLVPLTDADKTGTDPTGNGISVADLSFYYTKAGSLTVTCAVNYTSPDGKTGTMTVKSPSITYTKPTAAWQVGKNYDPAFRHMAGFFADPTNQQYGAHETWGPINITVPDPFTGGHGCIAQIATLGRAFIRHSPQSGMPDTTYNKVSVLNADGTKGAVDTPTGLDISYPYPYGYNKDKNGNFTLVSSAYTWEVGSMGYSDDQPFSAYTTRAVDGGGNLWWSSGVNDSFDTWVMYRPPPAGGGGTIYVPLMKLKWQWGGYASMLNGAWSSGEGTPFREGSPSITDDYPSWHLSIPSGFSVGP